MFIRLRVPGCRYILASIVSLRLISTIRKRRPKVMTARIHRKLRGVS